VSVWIDLMHGLTGRPAGLAVQVETLDKDAVIAQTADPDVTLAVQTQLNTLANVQPGQHTIRYFQGSQQKPVKFQDTAFF